MRTRRGHFAQQDVFAIVDFRGPGRVIHRLGPAKNPDSGWFGQIFPPGARQSDPIPPPAPPRSPRFRRGDPFFRQKMLLATRGFESPGSSRKSRAPILARPLHHIVGIRCGPGFGGRRPTPLSLYADGAGEGRIHAGRPMGRPDSHARQPRAAAACGFRLPDLPAWPVQAATARRRGIIRTPRIPATIRAYTIGSAGQPLTSIR